MKDIFEKMKSAGRTEAAADRSFTWYGVNKTVFIRLALAALLFCAGLFLPENAWTVFLMLFSFLISGYDVVVKAVVRLVKERALGEELLLTIAAILSFTINAGYEGAAVMLIYQAGCVLRAYASELTRSSLRDKVDPYPSPVTVEREEETLSLAPEQIEVGDTLLIKPGERFPVDCRVTEGESQIELGELLGASRRRDAAEGASIPAGAVNLTAPLKVRASGTTDHSTFAKVIEYASDEELGHSSTEDDIQRFGNIFAPFALGLSVLIALLLLIFTRTSTENAIHRALILLILATPAAILAPVPLAYLAGLYRSVKKGVLVKGSAILDAIARVGAVVMDKDEMLSTGEFRVLSVKSPRMDPNVLLKVAAHAASGSSKPAAVSITSAYEGIIDRSMIQRFEEFDEGVSAVIDGITISMGSREFMELQNIAVEDVPEEGEFTVYMSLNGMYAGCILLADSVRENARASVMAVESTGCDCILLSGDTEEKTSAAASAAGIREYFANCMPLDRLEKIQEIKERFPVNSVVYLGRGARDSACLSAADVGACVNGLDSDAALSAGSVVVMDDDPAPLADAIDSAKITRRSVRQTILICLVVKAILLVLALAGITYQLWFAMMVDVVMGVAGILLCSRILDGR
ncbi:MAG: HAD-IC family P-type ATPase [Oscillospiraceae bacterium]|nr:HAD-IC family P-type ATPase [Oscillospiraceae bacterium]